MLQRDSPALSPVISQVHTYDFVASSGAIPPCLPQILIYNEPAILLDLQLHSKIAVLATRTKVLLFEFLLQINHVNYDFLILV